MGHSPWVIHENPWILAEINEWANASLIQEGELSPAGGGRLELENHLASITVVLDHGCKYLQVKVGCTVGCFYIVAKCLPTFPCLKAKQQPSSRESGHTPFSQVTLDNITFWLDMRRKVITSGVFLSQIHHLDLILRWSGKPTPSSLLHKWQGYGKKRNREDKEWSIVLV